MRFNPKRIALGVAVAVVLVLLLATLADLTLADFASVSPAYVALAVLFSMLALVLRALNYRIIANQTPPHPMRAWIDLSLRHQFLFTAVPSGLGDIGFPVLAKRYVGTDLARGAAIIGMARLRDLCILPALGCLGLAALGHVSQLFLLSAFALVAAGFFAEQMVAPLAARLGLAGPSGSATVAPAKMSYQAQFARTSCTLASWLSAGCALWSSYHAAGMFLGPAAVFILLAGLNLIGVIAISIGGLGVAEAGSTGVLALLGMPLEDAAQLSLIARPILLISVLLSCVLWWVLRKTVMSD